MGRKLVQKDAKIGSIFGSTFLKPLELFRCLLGAFLGLSRLSWTAFAPQKPLRTEGFFRVFANAGFCDFEALDGPLRAHLGPS